MRSHDESRSPPPDLGLLFAADAVDLEARIVFVDRVSEQQAFDQAVVSHCDSTRRPEFDSQDVVTSRRNVLVFYGVGGVGKTSLSREQGAGLVAACLRSPTGMPAHDHGALGSTWPAWRRS